MKSIAKPTKTTIVLLTIIVVLVVALAVVLVTTVFPQLKEKFSKDQNTDSPHDLVVTPYCNMKYPSQWKDQMKVEESIGNDVSSYVFYAVMSEKHYELYTVYFGESERGDLLGYLPNDGNDIPVYIECHRPAENELTKAESALFYSMMEGVNDVVQSIVSTKGYYRP